VTSMDPEDARRGLEHLKEVTDWDDDDEEEEEEEEEGRRWKKRRRI
jgi:hypothetical protein